MRRKSLRVYKINEYNAREIDWRFNRNRARWQRLDTFATPEEARQALLQLEKKEQDDQ